MIVQLDQKMAEQNGALREPPKPPEEVEGFSKILTDKSPRLDGWRVPLAPHTSDPVEFTKSVQKMEMRDDDVIVAAYPKCGTHWMWEVTKMLRKGQASMEMRTKETVMLEFSELDLVAKEPSPRTLNSHMAMVHLPKQIKEKKVKIIHLVRNPKDVFVSFFFHLSQMAKMEKQEFLDKYVADQLHLSHQLAYLRQMQEYQKNNPEVPYMTIYYEEMQKNPVDTTKALAKFLGLNVTEEFCKEVVDACSFQKMKEVDHTRTFPEHLLKKVKLPPLKLYRKGQVGDWKNNLTVAQNEILEAFIEKESAGLDYHFTYV